MSDGEMRPPNGLDALENAIRRAPGDAQAQNSLGIALGRAGEYVRARECFSRAVQLSPENPRYWFNLGTADRVCGQPLRAARYYQIALRFAPDYEKAKHALETLRAAYPQIAWTMPSAHTEPSGRTAGGKELADDLRHEFHMPFPAEEPKREARRWSRGERREAAAEGPRAPHIRSEICSVPVEEAHEAAATTTETLDPTAICNLGSRVVAGLVDGVVVQCLWVCSVIVVNLIQMMTPQRGGIPNGIPVGLGMIITACYAVLCTWRHGQTVGKRVMALRVVDRAGGAPGLARCVVRMMAAAVNIPAAGLGLMWAGWDGRREAIHDKVSATYVVGRRLDPGTAVIWCMALGAVNLYLGNFLRAQLF